MTETTPKRAADSAIAVTAWTTTLLTQEWATSELKDTTGLMDALLGGVIEADTVTGIMAAGESFDIYILGKYSATNTDVGGGIDALLTAAAEQVEDVDFVKANLNLLKSIQLDSALPDTQQGYQWGPIAVAQFFGGVLPREIMLLLHNNTGASLGTGSDVNMEGITYETL